MPQGLACCGLGRRASRDQIVVVVRRSLADPVVELFATWSWIPIFLAASPAATGFADPPRQLGRVRRGGRRAGVGCVAAGAMADRLGRTTLTITAMAISGTCAVLTGLPFGQPAVLVVGVALVWGITVVADSAQFSTDSASSPRRGRPDRR